MLANATATAVNTAAVAALRNGSLGFGFSGGGFLIFYFLGVVDTLFKLGILTSSSKVAGTSAGGLVALSICSGLSPQQLARAATSFAEGCQVDGNCGHVLDHHVRRFLNEKLPEDAWERCSGKGYLSISMGSVLIHSNLLITDFTSKDDLVDAAAASAWIPFWSGKLPETQFRGSKAIDGGFTKPLPCPEGVDYCVRVGLEALLFPASSLVNNLELMDKAADHSTTRFDRPLPPLPSKTSYDWYRIQMAEAAGFDIAPNVYTPLPFTALEWSALRLIPGSTKTLQWLQDAGRRDAAMWATRTGLAAAAKEMQEQAAAAAAAGKDGR